jgi:hypothetical protein
MKQRISKKRRNIAEENFHIGMAVLHRHPLFAPLLFRATVLRHKESVCPPDGWAIVTDAGRIHIHPTRRAEPEHWVYVVAHCLLHLGFGHFQKREDPAAWAAACDIFVTRFLATMKLGRIPSEMEDRIEAPMQDEAQLYLRFCEQGVPSEAALCRTSGSEPFDMWFHAKPMWDEAHRPDWQSYFAYG